MVLQYYGKKKAGYSLKLAKKHAKSSKSSKKDREVAREQTKAGYGK